MKTILFSPVGTTDPVANYKDGPMLHICRHYKPDLVYLYLSKEMYAFHHKDNRFVNAIEKLGEQLGHKFEVKLIIREELVDVQKFDFFIGDFTERLQEIIKKAEAEAEGAEILLNVSSGSPAMKSVLQTMAALQEFPMKPIQVSTPVKGYNPHAENKEQDDYLFYIKENEDNIESKLINRCSISVNFELIELIQKEMLKKLIQECDYTGASILASKITNLSSKFHDLLRGACSRVKLDYWKTNKLFNNWGYSILPIEDSNKASVVEAMLYLDLKLYKEEYGDFLRGSTPVILVLFERVLKKQCNFDVNLYVQEETRHGRKWDRIKLEQEKKLKDILTVSQGDVAGKPISSAHLEAIAAWKLKDEKLKETFKQVREFERKTRNEASHEIVAVTKELIQKKADDMEPEEMFKKLIYILGFTDIQVKEPLWITSSVKESKGRTSAYDKMNQILVEAM